jgi:hypothetical protein
VMQLFGELPPARLPATRFTPYTAFGNKSGDFAPFSELGCAAPSFVLHNCEILTDCHHHLADGCQNTQIS